MKLQARVIGDLSKQMKQEIHAGERAVTESVHATGVKIKEKWRGEIRSAGLGRKVALSIREKTYPVGGVSFDAASLIWTKAPKALAAHTQGVTIRSKKGLYLAIPTPAAGRDYRGFRLTPKKWERERGIKLRFIYRQGKPGLLVADDARLTKAGGARANRRKRRKDGILTGALTVPIFILVPQVRLRKRLDLDGLLAEASGTPEAAVARWERYSGGYNR